MVRNLAMSLLVGLACGACVEASVDPADPPSESSPEITGSQIDPLHGFCRGNVESEPSWARCSESCDRELASCIATSGCRAIFADDLRTAAVDVQFRNCVPTAALDASAPLATCGTLDAIGCSRRNDCIAVHSGLFVYTPFVRCLPESCLDPSAIDGVRCDLTPTAR